MKVKICRDGTVRNDAGDVIARQNDDGSFRRIAHNDVSEYEQLLRKLSTRNGATEIDWRGERQLRHKKNR